MSLRVLLFSALLCLAGSAWAQVPQGIAYQAVARDGGQLLSLQALSVGVSLRSGHPAGPLAYAETHAVQTNAYGGFALVIGQGSPQQGTFAAIDWGADEYYLEVSLDAGNGPVLLGTTRLESVPYSQVAGRAYMRLGELLDVSVPSPSAGDILRWDGTQWGPGTDANTTYTAGAGIAINANQQIVNTGDLDPSDDLLHGTPAGGDLTDNLPAPTLKAIQGKLVLAHNPAPGQVLKWNGNAWTPGVDAVDSSRWRDHASGIYYTAGAVGIGTAQPIHPLQLVVLDTLGPQDRIGMLIDVDKVVNTGGNTTGLYVDAFKSGSTGTTFGANLRARNHNTSSSPAYGSLHYAYKLASNGATYGLYATHAGNAPINYAGYFAGDVYTTGLYLPSDQRLKQGIAPLPPVLDRVLSLPVHTYTYDQARYPHMHLPGGAQAGFLAQEVAGAFPELVRAQQQPAPDPDAVAAGELPAGEAVTFDGVNYTGLIPYLTRAIQEQQAQIQALQARVAELEAARAPAADE